MADIANLVLAVDATQVKTGTAALDGLTAAGARAEVAAVGLGGGVKGAGVAAAAMAAQAQASSRAAMGMATGFKASAEAATLNTIAMRETLVVARELSRGNLTRIPGSLSLLAQNVSGGIGGYINSLLRVTGILKTVQNAELAEEAANAAAAATAVASAAKRAASAIMAADTEIALAQAAQRTAVTSEEEAAAAAQLSAAHEAQTLAAREAAIAENALAVAEGRAAEAAAANAAATRTVIGGTGIGLIGLAVVAGVAYGAFKQFQDQVRDDGTLTAYRDSLGLTHAEMLKLSDGVDKVGGHIKELGAVTVTFGDVMHGVWGELTREVSNPSPWDNLAHNATSAFSMILSAWNKVSAGISAGLMTLGKMVGDAIDPTRIKNLSDLNYLKTLRENYGIALKQNADAFAGIKAGAIQSAENRMSAEANALKEMRTPKKPRKAHETTDPFVDMAARLDQEILSAKLKLAGTAQEQAALALQEVTVEKNKTVADAKQLLAKHKITAGEEMHLVLQAAELDDLKRQAILREEQTKLLTQQQAAQDQLYGFQTDALKFADEMATTQSEHRKAQLDMLNIAYEQKKYDLQILLEKQKIAGDLAGQALTQGQIANLPTEQARQQALVLKNTANPLEQWMQSVPHDAAMITEALQQIQVKGLDGIASAITDVITGTKSLSAAFKDVARSIISDILQMTIRMLIFRAISGMFGGGLGGVSPFSSPGTLTASANGNVFSGGNVIPFASGGVISSPTLFPMSGGRTGLMGEAGPEAVMPLARDSSGRLGVRAGNDNAQRVVVELTLDNELLGARIVEGANAVVEIKRPGIVQQSVGATLRTAGRPALMGRR